MRLTHLKLSNYRCFESLEMTFHPQMTVIVGENGAGKSAVLEALSETMLLGGEVSEKSQSRRNRVVWQPATATFATAGTRTIEVFGRHPRGSDEVRTFDVDWKAYRVQDVEVHNSDFGEYEVPVGVLRNASTDYFAAYYPTKRDRFLTEIMARFTELMLEIEDRHLTQVSGWLHSGMSAAFPEYDARMKVMLERLATAVPGAKGLRYSKPDGGLVVTTDDATVRWVDLSSGYSRMIAIVASLFEQCVDVLGGATEGMDELEGVVLIDEIDLHLHPRWQRMVLGSLLNAFPAMQFIVTTHSPQVIASAQREWIRVLDRNGQVEEPTNQTFGADSNRVLRDIFGVSQRPVAIETELNRIAALIDDGVSAEDVQVEIRKLQARIGMEDGDLNGLIWDLNMREAIDAQDSEG